MNNDLVKTDDGEWLQKGEAKSLTAEEQDQITSITVVPSDFGASACILLKNGHTTFIPLSKDAAYGIGETINVENLKIIILTKDGRDVFRAL